MNERIFAAHLTDDSPSLIDSEACPNKFFRDVAAALERNWEKAAPAAAENPDVSKM